MPSFPLEPSDKVRGSLHYKQSELFEAGGEHIMPREWFVGNKTSVAEIMLQISPRSLAKLNFWPINRIGPAVCDKRTALQLPCTHF